MDLLIGPCKHHCCLVTMFTAIQCPTAKRFSHRSNTGKLRVITTNKSKGTALNSLNDVIYYFSNGLQAVLAYSTRGVLHTVESTVNYPGGWGWGVIPFSLGGGVPLGSRKAYPLLDQILQIL